MLIPTVLSRTLLDSSAQVVKDYAGNTLYPLVQWVLDSNSRYEISSIEHLIQLMNSGTVFENTGSVPTDYMGSDYIQTVDIDLEGDSTNIAPIGLPGATFQGEYDGNGFTVSNWNYVNPNHPSLSGIADVGFFGRVDNATLKNIKLAGVCTLTGFQNAAGMVVGTIGSVSTVFNIEADLSPGSFITQGDAETGITYLGGLVGRLSSTGVTMALTLRGELTLTYGANAGTPSVGGVAGYMTNCDVTLIRNLATFPAGISGFYAGGICGYLNDNSLTKVLNAMTGDISDSGVANTFIEGIAGRHAHEVTSESSEIINSMKGNITSTETSCRVGGMIANFGVVSGSTTHTFLNYMTGDVLNTERPAQSSGFFGLTLTPVDLATSINAMNGETYQSIGGTLNEPVTIDTSFGLAFTVDTTNTTTTPVSGLATDPENGLPIVDLTATDPDGVTHTFEFIFGNPPTEYNQLQINLSGENLQFAELEIYDLNGTNIALLGTATITAPHSNPVYAADKGNDGDTNQIISGDSIAIALQQNGVANWTLDLDRAYTFQQLNKVVFYNRDDPTVSPWAVGGTITFHSADGGDPEQVGVLTADLIQEFVITPVPMTVVPRALSARITVTSVSGATAYRLTSQMTGSPIERVVENNFTVLNQTANNLTPETEYTFRLYATEGSVYSLVHESTVSTRANSADNYDSNDFLGTSGRFDLTALDTTSVAYIADVMNDVFTTGDAIDINVGGGAQGTKKSKFVNRGGNVSIDSSEAIVAPFSKDAGAGQSISLTLADASTVSVAYDDTSEAITVGLTSYSAGEHFVLDGKKTTIVDI